MNTQYFLSSDNTISYAVCNTILKWRFLLKDGNIREVKTSKKDDIKKIVNYLNSKHKFSVCTYYQYLTLKSSNK